MESQQQKTPHKTPVEVKRELDKDYKSLAKTMNDTAEKVKNAAEPTGIFSRWFHTSTS